MDAIGSSAAGVYVDSEVRVASLFRGVPRERFERRVRRIFRELRDAWGGVPSVVVNDGEVTALAGAMLSGVGGLLGVVMGPSEAAGYVTPEGRLTSWLDELAFVPIDAAPDAPVDEWSGDRGCGARYLWQQAVGDEQAVRVCETLGVYLGYALLEYRELYDYRHVYCWAA